MIAVRSLQRLLVPVVVAAMGGGCATVVPQDIHSGKDAKPKGAKNIATDDDDGTGKAHDIVTYPGGDRVDWKVFEVKKEGNVTITLKWIPPRDGLDLAMNVTDANFSVIGKAKPSPNTGKRKKSVEIDDAKPGKYYVQVYAPRRNDAGEYDVSIDWEAATGGTPSGDAEFADADIPNPPALPSIPQPEAADAAGGGGGGGGGAGGNTPPPPPCAAGPVVPGQACTPTTANCVTGQPPPANVTCVPAACQKGMVWDPATTQCAIQQKGPKTKHGKIVEFSSQGHDLVIRIDKGKRDGITEQWTGVLLDGNSEKEVNPEITFTVFHVTDAECQAKVGRTKQSEFGNNRRVLMTEPAQSDDSQ